MQGSVIKPLVGQSYLLLDCPNHLQRHRIPLKHPASATDDPYRQIKELIQAKLEDGSWNEVVARRRNSPRVY
jgi:hypothetical protein